MYPVLFSLGPLTISSFGFLLALAFLAGTFVIWKLARIYDLDQEKILDLVILTFLGGIIGARAYFVILNWPYFTDWSKIVLINRYPGLSFWGGIIGVVISLLLLTKRLRLNFWQVADLAAVGFSLGLAIGDLGCFLGGCGYGVVSTSLLATPVVGLVGKRLPVSLVESGLLLILFFYLWGKVLRFHFAGKIIFLLLIMLGMIKFGTEFFRGDSQKIWPNSWFGFGHLFSLLLVLGGFTILYTQSKRSLIADLGGFFSLPFSPKRMRALLLQIRKGCYNYQVNLKIQVEKWRSLKRRFNVKSTPPQLG